MESQVGEIGISCGILHRLERRYPFHHSGWGLVSPGRGIWFKGIPLQRAKVTGTPVPPSQMTVIGEGANNDDSWGNMFYDLFSFPQLRSQGMSLVRELKGKSEIREVFVLYPIWVSWRRLSFSVPSISKQVCQQPQPSQVDGWHSQAERRPKFSAPQSSSAQCCAEGIYKSLHALWKYRESSWWCCLESHDTNWGLQSGGILSKVIVITEKSRTNIFFPIRA